MTKVSSFLLLIAAVVLVKQISFAQNCESIALKNAASVSFLINGANEINFSIVKDNENINLTFNSGGKDYTQVYNCVNDTLYYYKGKTPQYIINGADTLGVSYFGAVRIPLNLKVGDTLSSSIDITNNDFTHTSKLEASKSSSYVSGNYLYTTSTLYEDNVLTTFSNSTITINNVNAMVVAKETINVLGKDYEAYKISSEIWTRTNSTVSSSSESSKTVDERAKKVAKQINKRNEKIADKLADNNQGYRITPVDQWFVPEIGTFVKTLMYNSQKILVTTKVELKSIN